MTSQRFPARSRLLKTAEFEVVYRRRVSVADDVLLVYACENGREWTRVGLSVSRKVGGAVERNRWKRLLREAFRLSRVDLPTGFDLVLIPRVAAPPPLAELRPKLVALARRAVRRLEKK